MQRKKQKTVIIFFGQSQTGKSSLINHITRKYICKVFNYNEGRSCTNNSECFGPFTTRTGHEILVVDTQGLNDSRPDVIDANIKQSLVDQIIKEFINQISSFNPDKIVFCITESLIGNTIQFLKNLTHICDLFGKNSLTCSVIVLTKYQLQPSKLEANAQQIRMKVIQEENQKFCQELQIPTISTCPFYTQIINDDKIDTELSITDEHLLLPQEESLFKIIEQVNSYPIQIIKDYKIFCDEMITKLKLEDGVGIKKVQKVRIKWTDEQRTTTSWVPKGMSTGQKIIKGLTFGLLGGGRNFQQVTNTEIVKVPSEEPYTEDVVIKNHDDVVKLFMEDERYKEIRMKKLDELMRNNN